MKKILLSIIMVPLIILTACVNPVLAADDEVFDEVRELVEEYYVDPVDVDSLHAVDSRELVQKLGDPFTRYLTSQEFANFMGSINGEFAGIGVYLNTDMQPRGIEIIGIIEGSPAEKAGLQAGDVISQVDGVLLKGLSTDEACTLLKGPAGSEVHLEIIAGQKKRAVNISRQDISVPVVSGEMMNFHTAYIDIDSFSMEAVDELVETLEKCRKKGADKWIIDLRGNPGGHLDTAVNIASLFTGSAGISLIEEKDGTLMLYAGEVEKENNIDGPVILLIDKDSASASEILAAALKDYRRAVIVGETSYGKGTVQQIFPLSNGDWLKLTTARFYSPAGEVINGVGVTPDIFLDNPVLKSAELLLSDPAEGDAGSFELLENGYEFVIDAELARSFEYWGAWGEIVDNLNNIPAYKEKGEHKYELLGPKDELEPWNFYYPDYSSIGTVNYYGNEQDIILYLSDRFMQNSLPLENVEMRSALTGEQIELTIENTGKNQIRIRPINKPQPGEYWLLVPELFSDTGITQTPYLGRVHVH